jgi:WS/DGAT/MGAT family acyltransferase
MLADGAGELLRRGLDVASFPVRIARTPERLARIAGEVPGAGRALVDAVRPAPSAPLLNDPISAGRHLALLGRPLEDLSRIKRAFGVKLNDVVLAVCSGAVRRFLVDHGEPPIRLKAMVPVSVRDPEAAGELGNMLSFIFVDLPCDEPDPVRRLRDLHRATSLRKTRGQPEGAKAVIGSIGLTPRPLQGFVSRLVASPRAFNLVVSNIPGPREPLYMKGCLLEEAFPVVPIPDRHALAIGITTVRDRACFGLYAAPDTLPDTDRLATGIDAEIDTLLKLRSRAQRPIETEVLVSSG